MQIPRQTATIAGVSALAAGVLGAILGAAIAILVIGLPGEATAAAVEPSITATAEPTTSDPSSTAEPTPEPTPTPPTELGVVTGGGGGSKASSSVPVGEVTSVTASQLQSLSERTDVWVLPLGSGSRVLVVSPDGNRDPMSYPSFAAWYASMDGGTVSSIAATWNSFVAIDGKEVTPIG